MKQVFQILLLLLAITPCTGCGEMDANRLTGTIRVVDPEGNPVQDPSILLNVSFTPMQSYHLYEGRPSRTEDLKADAVGIFTYDVWASSVGLTVTADGYWRGRVGTGEAKPTHLVPGTTNTYRYDFDVVLQPAINPRPLFVHSTFTNIQIPGLDTEYGYDLERGDWVRPHGRGTRVDLILSASGDFNENEEFDLTVKLRFPNEHDGILPVPRSPERQSTHLLLGQEAPENGYQPVWQQRFQRVNVSRPHGEFPRYHVEPPYEQRREIAGYWFRVHTVVDPESGEVVRARYGKLSSEFRLGVQRLHGSHEVRGTIQLQYLYAPDHSRSVEWDGTNTLVPGGNIQGMHIYR